MLQSYESSAALLIRYLNDLKGCFEHGVSAHNDLKVNINAALVSSKDPMTIEIFKIVKPVIKFHFSATTGQIDIAIELIRIPINLAKGVSIDVIRNAINNINTIIGFRVAWYIDCIHEIALANQSIEVLELEQLKAEVAELKATIGLLQSEHAEMKRELEQLRGPAYDYPQIASRISSFKRELLNTTKWKLSMPSIAIAVATESV